MALQRWCADVCTCAAGIKKKPSPESVLCYGSRKVSRHGIFKPKPLKNDTCVQALLMQEGTQMIRAFPFLNSAGEPKLLTGTICVSDAIASVLNKNQHGTHQIRKGWAALMRCCLDWIFQGDVSGVTGCFLLCWAGAFNQDGGLEPCDVPTVAKAGWNHPDNRTGEVTTAADVI